MTADAASSAKEEEAPETEIPKLPLILAFGVLFGVLPLLPHNSKGVLPSLIGAIHRRVGAVGLVLIPAVTLTAEKTAYDTYTAYHGRSIYQEATARPTPHGGFPSGGAQLPSFSLIETRRASEPVVFRGPFLLVGAAAHDAVRRMMA
mmetsp:Transcript_22324/g.88620  ORF Transcript_22324/g.88620 Transcript_22324/m.88620 type:complete len:147 (-) Transcript_22324:1122-1562(-)